MTWGQKRFKTFSYVWEAVTSSSNSVMAAVAAAVDAKAQATAVTATAAAATSIGSQRSSTPHSVDGHFQIQLTTV